MLDTLMMDVAEHDMVRLTIMSDGLNHEIGLPFMLPAQMTVERVMLEIERVLQSNAEWLYASMILVKFIHAPLPAGGGGIKNFVNYKTI